MPPSLLALWPLLAAGVAVALAAIASLHVLLCKRDSRAAFGWMGLIWLVPFLGGATYLLIGINRVETAASRRRRRHGTPASFPQSAATAVSPAALEEALGPDGAHLAALAGYATRLGMRPLVAGNEVEPLVNGDAAYPRMLAAIAGARRTLALASYIFNRDEVGQEFVSALAAAHRRGVDVRVIVDDAGALLALPSVVGVLRRAGVAATHFLPTFGAWRLLSVNLRNHRKLLVADGRVAFLGGLNIDSRSKLELGLAGSARDLHFRVEGPLVAQLVSVYALDWFTCTGEELPRDAWFPPLGSAGTSIARTVDAGPDDRRELLRWILLGALACAQRTVRIVTPYFLPDPALVVALGVAANRGVSVDVVVPGRTDLPFVAWAMFDQLVPVLERGVRVWRSPPPFDHSKLMVVDGAWSLVGSANWDARSLRLNFELVTEVWDRGLAARLDAMVEARIAAARPVTIDELAAQGVLVRLRGGLSRLFAPYY